MPSLDRAAHDVERAPQRGADLLDRSALIPRLGLERDLRERDLPCCSGVADGVGEGAGTC